jgi:branched-chain amino acid transport system permease protein
MKSLLHIALFALAMAAVPLVTDSGALLNFVMMALYASLLAQAWNLLGGFGGQFSFGHALFFGFGAYVQAIGQLQGGLNPWVALVLAGLTGATPGWPLCSPG